ncbi:pyrroline-5-carboxylate reductase 1, mitochondrial-like isoform X1 [Hydractinia symbiolongicarpus]|uniref:pyrroline-5-carboxylate reductase 1, mitochondrial-like isoform X1 n=1 Tax=Hydractinia symbiolongicarpus TaxID=13093 RepID=UPI002550A261|nr:pyrroline-5-carboxylate reductase 1, mitochondrial-like isoform X1 [Hydractinia symbiolongicarpus]
MMEGKKVGFIGGGNMAYAIAKGLVSSGLIKKEDIITSAKTQTRLQTVWKDLGVKTTTDNIEVAIFADIIFLAVKPHILPSVLTEISSEFCVNEKIKDKLFVSVAAGVTISIMEEGLSSQPRVIRTMPNTPCLVQSGVVVYACGQHCVAGDGKDLETLLSVVGHVEEVEENHIDAMSSLMGCSIAWFDMIIEAMSDGGVKNGVPRKISYTLAAKAMEGAAKLFLQSGKHAGQLKDEVTSPGGSTICGLYELEQAGMRGIFMRAVDAATNRNKELGKQK